MLSRINKRRSFLHTEPLCRNSLACMTLSNQFVTVHPFSSPTTSPSSAAGISIIPLSDLTNEPLSQSPATPRNPQVTFYLILQSYNNNAPKKKKRSQTNPTTEIRARHSEYPDCTPGVTAAAVTVPASLNPHDCSCNTEYRNPRKSRRSVWVESCCVIRGWGKRSITE